jgi:hypothetical protein
MELEARIKKDLKDFLKKIDEKNN